MPLIYPPILFVCAHVGLDDRWTFGINAGHSSYTTLNRTSAAISIRPARQHSEINPPFIPATCIILNFQIYHLQIIRMGRHTKQKPGRSSTKKARVEGIFFSWQVMRNSLLCICPFIFFKPFINYTHTCWQDIIIIFNLLWRFFVLRKWTS